MPPNRSDRGSFESKCRRLGNLSKFLAKHEHDDPFCRSCQRCVLVAVLACLICAAVIATTELRRAVDRPDADKRALSAEIVSSVEPEKEAREALVVPEEARAVERGSGAAGSFFVSYMLTEQFPARNTLQRISSRLKQLGCVPLKEDWLNPSLPSSHTRGWSEFLDITGKTPRHEHQWCGQWQDVSGNVVTFCLRYSYPQAGPRDVDSLYINGLWSPAQDKGIKKEER